jgi:iron complex transport system ATP-binding protein
MTATTALLSTDALTLRVGPRTLVGELALQIRAGELWCVLGPNGSGKTTLLHTLAGLRKAHGGQVHWLGRAASAWRVEDAARWRGLLPQTVHDSFAARALDVVLMGRHPHLARWARWTPRRWPTATSPACRAANASVWPLPHCWRSKPRCCCSTSRPRTWT